MNQPQSVFTQLPPPPPPQKKKYFSCRSRQPCLDPQRLCREMASCEEVIQGYARLTRIFSLDASIPCHAYSEVIRSDYLLCLPLQVIYYVNFYEPRVAFVCGLCAALRKPRARGGKKRICVLSARSAKLVTHADYFCHSGLLWNV